MDRLNSLQVMSPSAGVFIAVAVGFPQPEQRHIGMVYRAQETAVPRFLHLAWHFDLRDEELDDRYFWIEVNIHEKRARQVAAQCRQVLLGNPDGLPYAFSYPNKCFDSVTGAFLFGPTKLGLTCATFVLAVFESSGFPLARVNTWPDRPEDEVWRQHVIDLMTKSNVPQQHIDQVKSAKAAFRVRPEEVAAAAILAPPEAAFDAVVVDLAKKVLDALTAASSARTVTH